MQDTLAYVFKYLGFTVDIYYIQTANKLSLTGLSRYIITPTRYAIFIQNIFVFRLTDTVANNTHLEDNFERNTETFNSKKLNYEFSLFLKVLFFASKGSLIIPEHKHCGG